MRWRAAAAALVLLATACGGGGDDEAIDDPVETTTGGPRDDQAIARDANLRISDFPDEWRSTPIPGATAAANVENNRVLADCMGRPRPEELRTAVADSEDFSAQDTRRASSSVQVVRTDEIARDDFAALRTDRAMECHKTLVDREFARQLPPEAAPQTSIERLPLPQFGEETEAFRISATTVANGVQSRTFIDLVFVRKGRVELSANFLNVGVPFPSDLERGLLQRMAGRA